MTQQIARYVSEGVDLAKAGKALEVYNQVIQYSDNNSLPEKSHYAFGWIIYYALHQAADSAIHLRKTMLARYLRLNVPKPHKLHSMILTQALRLYKDAGTLSFNRGKEDVVRFSLIRFAELWDISNFRPGDWRRKEYEGKQLGSTVEKFITHYVDELTETSTPPSPGFNRLIDDALAAFPDSHNILYQRGMVHIIEKNKADAIATLKKAVLLAPTKHYLWYRLATLIDSGEDLRLHISLLFKALSSPGPEQFKGKIRIALAKAWAGAGIHKFALHELMTVKRVYSLNGWQLSPEFNRIFKSIPENTSPEDPENAYRRAEPSADSFIYDALTPLEVRKTYHKMPKEGETDKFGNAEIAWRVTDENGGNFWFQPCRFGIEPQLPLGTSLLIKIYNGKIVKAELSPSIRKES